MSVNCLKRLTLVSTAGTVAIIVLTVLSIILGPVDISLQDIIAVLGLGHTTDPDQFAIYQAIILDLRLPRIILGILVGAGLAMVGAMLQTATRNDLADPFLFGLSAGAATGAVFVIVRFGEILGRWSLPIASFSGGILAALVVCILFRLQKQQSMERLVICGLAVSFLFGALTNYMIFAGDQHTANAVLFWSLGGLGRATWDSLFIAVFGLIILFILLFWKHLSLDALLAGEETAESLGIAINRLRILIFMACALATAAFVSLTGVIGFVGLMVPHLIRPLIGVRHLYFVPAVAIGGAVLMLIGDLACRLLVAPQELPLGIVTAAIGGFFVLALMFKSVVK